MLTEGIERKLEPDVYLCVLLLFSCHVMSNSLQPHGLQHTRFPPTCASPSLGVCPSSCPLNWWCYPTISSSVHTVIYTHVFKRISLLLFNYLVTISYYLSIFSQQSISSVQFSLSVVSDSLWPHEPQHARPPCPSPTPGVHPNPCPLSQ